jgi:hypothetical protein
MNVSPDNDIILRHGQQQDAFAPWFIQAADQFELHPGGNR